MIIGVMEMIVIMTIEAIINKHIVDTDRQDINLLLLDFKLHIFTQFGNIINREIILSEIKTLKMIR
jgi:hypothetical protein